MARLNTFGDIMREKANRQLTRQNADIRNNSRRVNIKQGQLNLANRTQRDTMADKIAQREFTAGEAGKERDFTGLESLRSRNFQESQSGLERNWKSGENKTLRGWQSRESIEERNSAAIEAAKERIARSAEIDKNIGATSREAELGRAHDVKLARVQGAINQGTAQINNESRQKDSQAERYNKYIGDTVSDTGEIDPYTTALNYKKLQQLGNMNPEQIQQAQQENEINSTREAISTMTDRQRKRYFKGLSPEMLEKLGIVPQQ
jgi:hypothetical protein